MNELNTFERIRIKASEEETQRFFARLDQETENLPGFHILFGHHILLLKFPDEETAKKNRVFLDLVYTEHEGKPDGTITVWRGKIENYLNISSRSGRSTCWEYTGENGFIRFAEWQDRILAYHIQSNRQYIIMNGPLDEYIPIWFPFRMELHNFSMSHDYVFVHSGAVGLNGEGVLISSVGGGGKSTTVLSCLLDGFDYVSDDYLILERRTATAYPLFNSGILNEDSLHRLPELKPLIYGHVPKRPNRYIIDLSNYRNQFCHGMKIKAVVYPRLLHTDRPGREALIRKDPLHVGKTQMVISSANQNGFDMLKDQDALHCLFGAVSDLPSYEMLLSQDRQSNCRALRDLICSLSKRKQ